MNDFELIREDMVGKALTAEYEYYGEVKTIFNVDIEDACFILCLSRVIGIEETKDLLYKTTMDIMRRTTDG